MSLKYKTRTNDIRGKSKVYFCCMEQDLSHCLDPISQEVLTLQPSATQKS